MIDRRFAIASLILGVIGLFYFGLIFGSLAIFFSIIALIKNYRGNESSIGIFLGIINGIPFVRLELQVSGLKSRLK